MSGARLLAVVIVVTLTAACSAGGSPAAHARASHATQPVGSGYLATDSNSVAFIQWVDDHGTVSGSAQIVGTQGTAPKLTLTSTTERVTGTVDGSTLHISFDGAPDTFGTVAGSRVTLNFPQSDGTLASTTFRKASTSAFDDAVSKLRAAVARSNQQAQAAQARADAETKLESDAQGVADALDQLTSARSTLASDLGKLPGTLQQQASDLTKTATDKQNVVNEAQQFPDGNAGQVCYDASQVAYDASQVAYDASSVAYNATSIASDISAIRGDIATIDSNLQLYRADTAAVPGYVPSNPPDETAIARTTSDGTTTVHNALDTTNDDLDRANALVATAYQGASAAAQEGSCGAAPTAPTPQPHIS